MNYNASKLYPFYKQLYNKIEKNDILTIKNNTVAELLFISVELDPNELYVDFNVRKSLRKYIERELNWYLHKTNDVSELKDIKVWDNISDINSEVNSNYGQLVFSRANFNQFDNVVKKLINDKYTRQGIIIYTRPSIHYEWNSFEVHDFICTNFQQFFIRDNKLITITNMRSEDAIYGTFNDIPWFHYVINKMYKKLKEHYSDLSLGKHIFTVNSFHVYQRHFELIKKIMDSEKNDNK